MTDHDTKLGAMMRQLAGDRAGDLQQTTDGRFILSATQQPEVTVSVEAVPEHDRVVMQALIGSLSGPESARMARAILQANAVSAVQGGPAIALIDETDAIFTIRALPFETAGGTVLDSDSLGSAIAAFIAQSIDLRTAISDGSVLELAATDGAGPDEFDTLIKV